MNEKKLKKIADFGISKQYDPNKEYTKTLNKVVSIYYSAPEITVKEYIIKRLICIH